MSAAGSQTTLGPYARLPCSGCGRPISPRAIGWYEHAPRYGYRAWHFACRHAELRRRGLRQ